jgi:predicted amidohydrolase YtcJ
MINIAFVARWTAPLLCGAFLFSSCITRPVATDALTADTIYTDGHVITMNDASPTAEALAVKDGKIMAVGSSASVLKSRGKETRVVNLKGKTLLPGFIDGHSHFINSLTVANQANVYAPPFGPGDSADGIVAALKKLQSEQHIRPGEWIMAYGYDENAVPADHPLTAADLDPAFPENPVMVGHVSLHGAVLNSVALKKFNITAATPTPEGGIILRKPGTQEPSGLLMETAFLPVFASLPKPSAQESLAALEKGQRIYAAAGITTAQDGASHLADVEILKRGAAAGKLFIDVVSYPFITDLDAVLGKYPASSFGKYDHGLKLGGVKVTTDGSPQGRTAFFTAPYLKGGPGGEQDWKGEPTFPKPVLQGMIQRVYDAGLPLIVHANGDAAIDIVLEAHAAALGDKMAGDHRTGIIHCQFVRPDQLDKIAAWNLIPSFYTEHVYFFGSTHVANRGMAQAEFISPLKTALSKGIRCANHTDFNVVPIDQMFVLWTAVNRVTREGALLGANERVTPMEGLKALTIHPAYWYREESRKGSLTVGKLADLVILDRNPLTVEPMTIKNIRVLETIKEGRTIYAAR